MKPPKKPGVGAGVEGPFEPGPVTDLDAFLQDDGTAAHIEHYARLQGGAQHDEVARVAEDDAAGGHSRSGTIGQEIGAVGEQVVLQCAQQVVSPAKRDAINRRGGSDRVRFAGPVFAGGEDPGDGAVGVGQASCRGRDFRRGPRWREIGPGDYGRPDNVLQPAAGRGIDLDEPGDMVAQDGAGFHPERALPPLPYPPDAGAQLGHRSRPGKRSPQGTGVAGSSR